MLLNLLTFGAIGIIIPTFAIYIVLNRIGRPKLSIIPKFTGSFLFVWFGIMAYMLNGENPFYSPLCWFLIFCIIADMAIEYNFIMGMLFFAAAHISLIDWSIMQQGFSWVSLIIWAAVVIIVLLVFLPRLKEQGKKSIAFILYGSLLVANFAVSVMLFVNGGMQYILMPIGTLMFVISDSVIGLELAGEKPWHKPAIMSLYWCCLFFVALTPWFIYL